MGSQKFNLSVPTLLSGSISLPLSKSLCNRALILAAQFPVLHIFALSNADDTRILSHALQTASGEIKVGAAGTAMRFLTAFYAAKPGSDVLLTGSERMHQRPIAVLVNALRQLGADIAFTEKEGFPPLKIKGVQLLANQLMLDAAVSSQFISALMLIGPTMPKGLKLKLLGEAVSRPYISMTANLMNQLGLRVEVSADEIVVYPTTEILPISYTPEADWSAAAFWYGLLAGAPSGEMVLQGLEENSLQGDSRLVRIFEELGVKTTFTNKGVKLEKRAAQLPSKLVINLADNPDLAQPLAFTCAVLGIGADFRGLQTLRIKETDRLAAIATELAKVGVAVKTTERSLQFTATKIHAPSAAFETYEDHRMAMSAAILATRFPVTINNPEVVSKSYPGFWDELESILH